MAARMALLQPRPVPHFGASGAVKWTSQVTAKDIFIVGCGGPGAQNGANCPPAEDLGPDFDFGNAPILVKRPDGKDVIVAGQKSGVGWAFDPDKKGAVLWQYRAGKGSALGGRPGNVLLAFGIE